LHRGFKNLKHMKKLLVISVSTMLMLSSCGTYTGSGAATGGYFGSIVGSAIGGITGGWRGSDIGSLVGLAGGAVVGAAIGAAADEAEQKKYEEYKAQRQERIRNMKRRDAMEDFDDDDDDSGFDSSNSGDDRLFGFDENFSVPENINAPTTLDLRFTPVAIRNPRLMDANRDGVLVRGEEARMVFEVFNNSDRTAYRVLPMVTEVTGNKHIHISENVMVESILPGKGIRYTATIKADSRLRDGNAVIRIGVMQGNRDIPSQAREFTIKTSRR
jgi:hypothetical protein